MLRTAIFLLLGTSSLLQVHANDPKSKLTRAQYIDMWKDVAVKQMQEHGIPASITLAQAILESGDGNSKLAREGNNHFGIKCHDWTGKKIYHDDDARNECFRKYGNAKESFEDHSIFLKRQRYAFLFDYDVSDYKSWAKGLKQAGYATNPKYPELLIRLIEENNLTAYDQMALGKMPKGKPSQKTTTKKQGKHASDEIVLDLSRAPKVFISENRIKYALSGPDDSVESLARKHAVGPWQVRKYNDYDKDYILREGTRVYLQPKRNKAEGATTHVVNDGETLHTISQAYGLKLKRLEKSSGLDRDAALPVGQKITLP